MLQLYYVECVYRVVFALQGAAVLGFVREALLAGTSLFLFVLFDMLRSSVRRYGCARDL